MYKMTITQPNIYDQNFPSNNNIEIKMPKFENSMFNGMTDYQWHKQTNKHTDDHTDDIRQ